MKNYLYLSNRLDQCSTGRRLFFIMVENMLYLSFNRVFHVHILIFELVNRAYFCRTLSFICFKKKYFMHFIVFKVLKGLV